MTSGKELPARLWIDCAILNNSLIACLPLCAAAIAVQSHYRWWRPLVAVAEMLEPQMELVSGCIELGNVPSVTLYGSKEALTSALLNLASNSIDAAGEGVVISMGAQIVGDRVEIFVADNGPGVPADLRERIFDPFYTGRVKGTGLGLTVVATIAKSHGGEVKVDDAQGGGARFVLALPLQSEAGQQNPGSGLWEADDR